MKGVETGIIIALVIAAVIALIGVGILLFTGDIPIVSYLSTTFQPCGEEEGSICCNLQDPSLEPFCSGGMVCRINVDPAGIDDPDVRAEYENSRCIYYQGNFMFDVDHYIYDDSCINGNKGGTACGDPYNVNCIDGYIGGEECEITVVGRDFFLDYMRQKKSGLGRYYTFDYEWDTSLYEGMEECENVFYCDQCGRYFGYGESYFCDNCQYCDTLGNCYECLECSESKDPDTSQYYSDCALCRDCSSCTIDYINDVAECEKCESCDICFDIKTYATKDFGEYGIHEMAYCKEADICDETVCYNNFFCGDGPDDYDEDVYCEVCQPSTTLGTTCKRKSDLEICEQIKDCIKYHEDLSDACLLFEDYLPIVDYDGDTTHHFTVDSDKKPQYEYNPFADILEEELVEMISSCQSEYIYKTVSDEGVDQAVCYFEAPELRVVHDASELPRESYEIYDQESFFFPGFLTDDDQTSDFKLQNEKVLFNDCGNVSGISLVNYDKKRSESEIYDYLLLSNDGEGFSSNTMPEGRSLRLAVSDMSFFDREGNNNCDFNLYMCGQRMLVDSESADAFGIYTSIRDMFESPVIDFMDTSEDKLQNKIETIHIEELSSGLSREQTESFGFESDIGSTLSVNKYFVTFDDNDPENNPTFEIDRGSKPMDAAHISNIIMAGYRDWSFFLDSKNSEMYGNIRDFVCYSISPTTPLGECNIDVRYNHGPVWRMFEADYTDIPSWCLPDIYESDIRVGKVDHQVCKEDLIDYKTGEVGGSCNEEAEKQNTPCWGHCDDHKYDVYNYGKGIRNLDVRYETGHDDCTSSPVAKLLDSEDDQIDKLDMVEDKSRLTRGTRWHLEDDKGNSMHGGYTFELYDDVCNIDNSQICVAYDALDDVFLNKNIYYVKTDDGLYHDTVEVFVGYTLTVYYDYNDDNRKIVYIQPVVRFKEK